MALAGFRGVGKSHFLAVLGALMAQPDCRSRVNDGHVTAAVQQLSRRPGAVAFVRRGTEKTLVDELQTAISQATNTKQGELGNSINELLLRASARSLDLPLVVLIDTANDREARVSRDDGPVLSEIAESALKHGVFLGLALDDDIAGADGTNSSIASTFAIDYLDQEHLYKIVNAHVFAKRDQMRPVLHDIYESYRNNFPDFRWSEHRFLTLYPLHPAILEVAPFIRLYLQDFALLGFASEAGLKIQGRPANSLIGLDEVFDAIESKLRVSPELKEALTAYDQLDREVIARLPVMKRLTAKLLLKGLLLLSLKDEGVGADELKSAMLIEGEGKDEIRSVLESFSERLPESVVRSTGNDGIEKFAFRLNEKDDLKTALSTDAAAVPAEAVRSILQKQIFEKFADLTAPDSENALSVDCAVVWRGGIRRGHVNWTLGEPPSEDSDKTYDWTVFIGSANDLKTRQVGHPETEFHWRLGDLTTTELDTIRRFHQLHTDSQIREKYRDSLPAAIHAHSIAVEKLWQRIFFEDGVLVQGENEYKFTADASSAHSFAEMFSIMLRQAFERLYPEHPHFVRTLEESDALLITRQLFGGSDDPGTDSRSKIADLALPLGLVKESDGDLVPLAEEEFLDLPIVRQTVLSAVSENVETFPVESLYALMRSSPFGLTSEAQHLLLSALVAQRHFEFVTSSGNRIHYRSLDLQIDWRDVIGIARPAAQEYTDERLYTWAEMLTGEAKVRSGKPAETRASTISALEKWLTNWNCNAVMARFDELPDEMLNSSFWRLAAGVRRSFGSVADSVDELIHERGSLDACLQNIADAFGDSEREFQQKLKDLAVLEAALNHLPELDRVRSYLIQGEATGDPQIDASRSDLIAALAVLSPQGVNSAPVLIEQVNAFKENYIAKYAERHAALLDLTNVRNRLDDFLGSDMWNLFSALSALPVFAKDDEEQATQTIRAIRNLECKADVKGLLQFQPICVCGFDISRGSEGNVLITRLTSIVATSLKRVMQLLVANGAILVQTVGPEVIKSFDDAVHGRGGIPVLSAKDIHLLKHATEGMAVSDRDLVIEPHPFESLSDVLLENELGRLENSTQRS
jgi:hypothetical protein